MEERRMGEEGEAEEEEERVPRNDVGGGCGLCAVV